MVEFHFGGRAACVLHVFLGIREGALEAEGDLGGKSRLRAACFPFDVSVVGHDVGRVARRLAFLSTEDADVAGAFALTLFDLSEPAVLASLGYSQRRRSA